MIRECPNRSAVLKHIFDKSRSKITIFAPINQAKRQRDMAGNGWNEGKHILDSPNKYGFVRTTDV